MKDAEMASAINEGPVSKTRPSICKAQVELLKFYELRETTTGMIRPGLSTLWSFTFCFAGLEVSPGCVPLAGTLTVGHAGVMVE